MRILSLRVVALRGVGNARAFASRASGAAAVASPLPEADDYLRPRIAVIGVGGAGGNAVNNMVRAQLKGIDFMVANTDAQALHHSAAPRRMQLGRQATRGLGAGANPEVGRLATEETLEEIVKELQGFSMVFVTAGMGGGTGTGAAPVIAKAARALDIVTVGVVTKPFNFEGKHRMRLAEEGLAQLEPNVDTLIVIPNQNLIKNAAASTTFADAFKMADNVLYEGVRGVTDLIVNPGLVNLDFADVKAVMSNGGRALMGTGEAEGAGRARQAVLNALENPLLEQVAINDARGCLVNIMGGPDLTLYEVDEIASCIRDQIHPDANLIFGSTFDAAMRERIRVSVVITGLSAGAAAAQPAAKLPLRESTPSRIASLAEAPAGTQPLRRPAGSVYGGDKSTTSNASGNAQDKSSPGGLSRLAQAIKRHW